VCVCVFINTFRYDNNLKEGKEGRNGTARHLYSWFIRVIRLMEPCDMNSFIHMFYMTHSYALYDWYIFAPYDANDSFILSTCLIDVCDMTYSRIREKGMCVCVNVFCVLYDSFICVSWCIPAYQGVDADRSAMNFFLCVHNINIHVFAYACMCVCARVCLCLCLCLGLGLCLCLCLSVSVSVSEREKARQSERRQQEGWWKERHRERQRETEPYWCIYKCWYAHTHIYNVHSQTRTLARVRSFSHTQTYEQDLVNLVHLLHGMENVVLSLSKSTRCLAHIS